MAAQWSTPGVHWQDLSAQDLHALKTPDTLCRPPTGSVLPELENLHSRNGVLNVDLTIRNSTGTDG